MNPGNLRTLAAALMLTGAGSAAAAMSASTPISLDCLTNNSGSCSSFVSGLSLSVTDLTSSTVSFDFESSLADGSIVDIYFDGAGVLDYASVTLTQSAGVSFKVDTKPGTLPGGNGSSVAFTADLSAGATSQGGKPKNGINNGESLALTFGLASGKSFADVLAGLDSGSLRLGMHVISLGEYSESFISLGSVSPVPEPESYAMMLAGLGLVGFMARRRRGQD